MQDMPNSCPKVLPPDFDKIDVRKLQQDIPKFYPWLKAESAERWSIFLSHGFQKLRDDAGFANADGRGWPMDSLRGYQEDSREDVLCQIADEESECMVTNFMHIF